MPSEWIGCIHKPPVGKRWSPREKTYRYDPEDKSCNAGRPEYNKQFHVKSSTEPTKDVWPSSVQQVRIPLESMAQDNS